MNPIGNEQKDSRASICHHDFAASIALGILSVSAYAVIRWFQIGAMIQGYIESEQSWGDGRGGFANILLLFASPPMFFIGCIGVNFLRRSFINAKSHRQPRWTFLRATSTIMLIPFALWIVFWLWILFQILLFELGHRKRWCKMPGTYGLLVHTLAELSGQRSIAQVILKPEKCDDAVIPF